MTKTNMTKTNMTMTNMTKTNMTGGGDVLPVDDLISVSPRPLDIGVWGGEGGEGVGLWLRMGLVKVLAPGVGMTKERAANFSNDVPHVVRELMYCILLHLTVEDQNTLRYCARHVCADGKELAVVLVSLYLGLKPNSGGRPRQMYQPFIHIFDDCKGAGGCEEVTLAAVHSLTELLCQAGVAMRTERVREALHSLRPSCIIRF